MRHLRADAKSRPGIADVESAVLEGSPPGAQLRLLHGDGFGTVRADGAFASAQALASALAYVRSLPTFAQADAGCVVAPRACMHFPHVWYAGSWPEELAIDAAGVFVEVHARCDAQPRTWFLPELGGVLGEPVRLPPDCTLLEGSLFDE